MNKISFNDKFYEKTKTRIYESIVLNKILYTHTHTPIIYIKIGKMFQY